MRRKVMNNRPARWGGKWVRMGCGTMGKWSLSRGLQGRERSVVDTGMIGAERVVLAGGGGFSRGESVVMSRAGYRQMGTIGPERLE